MPKEVLPDEGMNPDTAETLVNHIRLNEAKADQNLATFCTTQMEPQADRLMLGSLETNAIDKSEYPKLPQWKTIPSVWLLICGISVKGKIIPRLHRNFNSGFFRRLYVRRTCIIA